MAAPKQNNYWQFRNKHGRDYKYTPKTLWEEAEKYFAWVDEHPLWEMKVFAFQGVVTEHQVPKVRAMTITAFTLFADIEIRTWSNYSRNEDFIPVITRIENHIKSQKFEGAAAELLNPNIIARDLGLKDKADVTSNDQTIVPQIYIPSNGRD